MLSCGFIMCKRADHDDDFLMKIMRIPKKYLSPNPLLTILIEVEAEMKVKIVNYHYLISQSCMREIARLEPRNGEKGKEKILNLHNKNC